MYPARLISYVSRLPARPALALDAGTGNGQAAVSLARHFTRVIATDISRDQLQRAIPAGNIEYRHVPAEESGVRDGTVDLVTAAQALHWFDIATFFAEARRLLAPGGAIAVWGYGDPIIADPALDLALHDFNRGFLETYWPPEREMLLARYATIEFPFDEISVPPFEMQERWTLGQLTGYLRSWSAVGQYHARHGRDPVIEIEQVLGARWGSPDQRHAISWPLHVRAGRPSA